jgi:hypothetical protein
VVVTGWGKGSRIQGVCAVQLRVVDWLRGQGLQAIDGTGRWREGFIEAPPHKKVASAAPCTLPASVMVNQGESGLSCVCTGGYRGAGAGHGWHWPRAGVQLPSGCHLRACRPLR